MNAQAELFVDSRCELGEGPFWHPLLERLFWFDILNQTMLSAGTDGHVVDRITFKDTVSAGAVIDKGSLAIAQSGALLRYDFATDSTSVIAEIEGDVPTNRTNDSRVDRTGGFWIGTMGRKPDASVGGVYQYRAGQVTKVIGNIRIPNSICFSPDGRTAYFTDAGKMIIRCATDPATGLPVGPWEDFFTMEGPGGADGSAVDSEGYLWNARWGGGKVIRISPDGKLDTVVEVPGVSQVSCPAFGGSDLKTLYITTAREHMTPEQIEREPHAGSVFAVALDVPGIAEPFLKL
ncbi:MAG TPA: SMP-30/gluconolactonase/LRE family protein [Devosia sp.]|jgi:sugar lactone lactonase YvrE|uniref:SMP-30/gluconolactonase/LRE family protein n=1 Tax=Devosia sp. TaxID=1871048 RepID=UPI002DDD5825|nr:SMP-30/gluconolactonase/LRE family protein [Devosia sp.]HEV2516554.1 SMP-30/gluconolactonase/LRE family protein [Devosia sp.]